MTHSRPGLWVERLMWSHLAAGLRDGVIGTLPLPHSQAAAAFRVQHWHAVLFPPPLRRPPLPSQVAFVHVGGRAGLRGRERGWRPVHAGTGRRERKLTLITLALQHCQQMPTGNSSRARLMKVAHFALGQLSSLLQAPLCRPCPRICCPV